MNFVASAQDYGDRVASTGDDLALTFAEFDRLAERATRLLRAAGT